MVWKDNFIVGNEIKTYEGFSDEFAKIQAVLSTIILFYFPLCNFKTPEDMFRLRFYLNDKHFPQHFVFANFQCLRCGLCCKNYEDVEVEEEQIRNWTLENREDILKYVDIIPLQDGHIHAEIVPPSWTGCPLCRKARGKPYYSCKINYAKSHVPVCKAYLCSKSIPVAHIDYKNVDELINIIGLESYYSLIERVWGEEFDYSVSEVKTHKKRGLGT